MTFKELSKQACESDEGFIVQCKDRFQMEYIEGDKKISPYWRPLQKVGDSYVLGVTEESFNKWDDGTKIDDPAQKKQRFKEALKFLGCDITFE